MADLIRPLRGAYPGPAIEPDSGIRAQLALLGQVGVRYGGLGESATTPFEPGDLSDLSVFFRYDQGTFQDAVGGTVATTGDPVGAWEDQSGNSDHVSVASGNRGSLTVNGVTFNGTNQWLENTTTNIVTSASSYTVIVHGISSNATGGSLWTDRRSTRYQVALLLTSGGLHFISADGVNTAANVRIASTAFKTSEFTASWIYNGESNAPDFHANGVQQAIVTGIQTSVTGTTGFYIARNGGGQFWPGSIKFLIIYDRALNDTERGQVEQWITDNS